MTYIPRDNFDSTNRARSEMEEDMREGMTSFIGSVPWWMKLAWVAGVILSLSFFAGLFVLVYKLISRL